MGVPYGYLFDIEADNLYLNSTKIWYIRLKTFDGTRSLSIYPFRNTVQDSYDKIMEWVDSFNDGAIVAFHNGLGYDLWVLWKLLDIIPKVGRGGKDFLEDKHVQFIDTYILSQYLNPDSPLHSLEYLASGSEDEKLPYRQMLIDVGALDNNSAKGDEFKFYHPLMDSYCDGDVDANIGVFIKLWKKAEDMYKNKWVHSSFRQLQKDYWLYNVQAYGGSCFNQEKAIPLTNHIQTEMDKLKSEVDPMLPPRPLKTVEKALYKMPSKPYTKSGEQSAALVKWLEKHSAILDEEGFVHAYGLKQKLVANDILDVKMPMEISDNNELKQYFLDSGWQPTFWNIKKGPDGKPLRDDRGKTTRTSPKIQEAGVLCPNLLELSGEIPAKVVKFLSYRNRLGVVTGWLNNSRLKYDGRISSEISGYTPTFRVKHRTIVNCPKADPKVLLGYEMRDLFNTPKNFWYIGTDAAALENRTLAAYTMKYDGGAFARLILEGDSHTFNAFAFFPEIENKFDMHKEGLKDEADFKPYRNKAKTGAYLLAYGGGIPKLASSLNLSMPAATIAYDNYWKKNEGLGKLKDQAEKYYNTVGKKKYLPAWDGRILNIRSKNKIINCLGQSLGAIVMSIACCIMDKKLGDLSLDDFGRPYYKYKDCVVWRSNCTHDEYSWMAENGVEEDIRQMSVNSIIEAGEFLGLPIELGAEGKMSFEGSWRDVH
jgi:hypothetical protein